MTNCDRNRLGRAPRRKALMSLEARAPVCATTMLILVRFFTAHMKYHLHGPHPCVPNSRSSSQPKCSGISELPQIYMSVKTASAKSQDEARDIFEV